MFEIDNVLQHRNIDSIHATPTVKWAVKITPQTQEINRVSPAQHFPNPLNNYTRLSYEFDLPNMTTPLLVIKPSDGCGTTGYFFMVGSTQKLRIELACTPSQLNNHGATLCQVYVFSMDNQNTQKYGLEVYDHDGEVVFDSERPYLEILGRVSNPNPPEQLGDGKGFLINRYWKVPFIQIPNYYTANAGQLAGAGHIIHFIIINHPDGHNALQRYGDVATSYDNGINNMYQSCYAPLLVNIAKAKRFFNY